MKTKLLIATLALVCLCACSEDENGILGPHKDNHEGIEYKYGDSWEFAHGRAIDISGQPNDFTLEFRARMLEAVVLSDDNEAIRCTILDTITTDPNTGNILNKPVCDSVPYRYSQRVRFETNGEKHIEATFYYGDYAFFFGTSNIILTRE